MDYITLCPQNAMRVGSAKNHGKCAGLRELQRETKHATLILPIYLGTNS